MADAFHILQTEVLTDPLGRGYAAMSDQEVVDDMQIVNRDNWIDLSSSQVFEATDRAEFIALSSANQARVDRIYGLGNAIKSVPGSMSRTELIAVFGVGSLTIANLAAIANQQINRASELGIGGYVTAGRVAVVRA